MFLDSVKEVVAAKTGAICNGEKVIEAVVAEVNSIHMEYQGKLIEPMAQLEERREGHCKRHSAVLVCSLPRENRS